VRGLLGQGLIESLFMKGGCVMLKVLMLIGSFIFAISTFAFGQEKFSVSGEISFSEKKGEFLVWLKTQEEFEKRIEPRSPVRSLLIKPNPHQLKTKNVTFKFVNVPKDIYCIVFLQDLNQNGKLDHSPETGMPLEEYGYSGQYFFIAQWKDIKFIVDKDISGIKLKF
jgi:hypothetical protein